MKMKAKGSSRGILAAVGLLALAIVILSPDLGLALSRVCHHCHTMHNQENGASPYKDPLDEDATGPGRYCLKKPCLGCHANITGNELSDLVTGAPIVYNTAAVPSGGKGLAGGNFYWVADGSPFVPPDPETAGGGATAITNAKYRRGHNVYQISATDNLDDAPCGRSTTNVDPCWKCHDPSGSPDVPLQCESCHLGVKHHKPRGVTTPYRFLRGHGGVWPPTKPAGTDFVVGLGAMDYEAVPTQANHNEYKECTNKAPEPIPANSTYLAIYQSISSFCLGCHPGVQTDMSVGGTDTPRVWRKHPAPAAIKSYESTYGNLIYDPLIPVGRNDFGSYIVPLGRASDKVRTGWQDAVMCISCHRPHGSEYRYMLRWEYDPDTAVPMPSDGGGCLTCHADLPLAQ
ncbi:MAG: cytochrome c3 family protein [Pseudomonadota bacterium]